MSDEMDQVYYINRGMRSWHLSPTDFHQNHVSGKFKATTFKLIGCIKGEIHLETRKDRLILSPACMALIPPGMEHRFSSPQGPVEMMVLTFRVASDELLKAWLPAAKIRFFRRSVEDFELIQLLHVRCQRERVPMIDHSNYITRGMLQAILSVLMRWKSQGSPQRKGLDLRLERAHQLILENFANSMRVEEVARKVGMSVSHLREEYRKAYRCSPKQEFVHQRLQNAQRLLAETDLKIHEVALQCGYPGEHSFCKAFQKQLGISPGRWRKGG